MKHALLTIIVCFLSWKEHAIAQSIGSNSQLRAKAAKVNGLMDKILLRVAETLRKDGFDPYNLQDHYIINFTFTEFLNTKWHNSLGLFGGQLNNLTSIHRNGDATLEYNDALGALELVGDVAFGDLQVVYSFAAQAMNLGPRGTIRALVEDLRVHFVVAVNPDDFSIKLREFALQDARDIKVNVSGLSILDPIASRIANRFSEVFKKNILQVVEREVRKKAETTIASMKPTDVG